MSGRETGIGIAGLVVGAGIGAVIWSAIGPRDTTIDHANTENAAASALPGDDLQSENDRLQAELAGLKVELSRRKLAAAETEPAPEAKEASAGKPMTAIGVTFADERFQEALASIDWDLVGGSMKDMVPLLAKLAEAVANGETPDLAIAGEVQKLNGELLKAAQKIMEGNIPGTGVNGAFTHPIVVANQFGAALKAAGFELSKEQKESLDRAMKFYAAKDESLRLAAGDKAFQLEVLAEESQFKEAFYNETRALLTDEQRNALYSEHTTGRGGFDVFDSSLMLMEHAKPMQVTNAADLASKVQGGFSKAKLDAGSRKKLDAIISRWANELPADFWSKKGSALDRRGAMSSSRIRHALKRQTALYREIFANIKLSPKERAKLAKSLRIMVPLPR
jgi:hypothetical protein